MHAVWHGLIKGSVNTLAFSWLGLVAAVGIYTAPVALTYSLAVPPAVWPVLLVSGLCEVGYLVAMARGYDLGDLSLVYPLARGSAPLFVTLGAALLLSERLPALGYIGVALLVSGIYLISLARWADIGRPLRALATAQARWALLAGLFVAGYSTCDKVGVSLMPSTPYTLWTFIVMTLMSAPVVIGLVRPAGITATMRANWRGALVGGFVTMGNYFLVLWALAQSPASYVVAIRGISILFSAAWGAWALRERVSGPRLVGSILMVAGVATLALMG